MIIKLSHYAFMAALRDRVILSFLVLAALGVSLSFFMGSAAAVEMEEFAVVYAASGLRLVGILSLILFIVFYIRRLFEDKDIEFLLSRPVSRPQFILSHSLAFTLIAALLGLVIFGCVCAMDPRAISGGHFLWGASIIAEYVIIANAAIFFAMVLPSATMASLTVFGFYTFCRLVGQILGIIDFSVESGIMVFMEDIVEVITIFVPRLDLMGQTAWLIYDADGSIGYAFIVFQGVVFSAILIIAAMIDLLKRQF